MSGANLPSSSEKQRKVRRRQKALAAHRRRLQEENAIDLSQFRDEIFIHYRNGKRYVFVDGCSIQINGKWQRAVLYREEEGTDLYVRPILEFAKKFSPIDEQTRNTDVRSPGSPRR